MGHFGKDDLDRVIASGCTACGANELRFSTYVDARIPMMAGEPIGRLGWAYDGEAFCDGVYAVSCAACDAAIFGSPVCTRCHAEGGLAVALSTANALDVPSACPGCDGEEIVFFAFVPAKTTYVTNRLSPASERGTSSDEGHTGAGPRKGRSPDQGWKRADKATTDVDLFDDGFHGFQSWCKTCGVFGEVKDACPLCAAPGPLRDRPK